MRGFLVLGGVRVARFWFGNFCFEFLGGVGFNLERYIKVWFVLG